MKRYKHGLSHYRLLTGDMGKLYPVGCYEVLPGDTVQQASSALLRVSPLVAPVMHPVSVRIHHWFVPFRLVWTDWEKFITGGKDGQGDGASIPLMDSADYGGPWAEGSLMDYLGVPTNGQNSEVTAFAARAYNLIYNEFYRDQDLVTERPVPKTGGADTTSPITVATIAWEKDYFTSARPWPQKGPDVSLPLGTSAPVVSDGNDLVFRHTGSGTDPVALVLSSGSQATNWSGAGTSTSNMRYDSGLEADLTNATATNVNLVRRAFALQRYEEARAQYGSRYTEYLRYLGVRSSDARLQRPEYLGGGKQTIAFSEVLQTSPNITGGASEDVGVAELKGHGISALRTPRFRRFFEEHGVVLSLLSVRPKTMYATQMPRQYYKRTKEDYWQKELEQIGQQTILVGELFPGLTSADTFGYQDRYSEYKHIQSGIAGEFKSTLNYWHLGRIFASAPALNASFVECDPSKRIHAVETNDVLWMMVNNHIRARRMVRRSPASRII